MKKIRKIIRRLWRSWIVFNEYENRKDERPAHYGPGGTIV